MKIKKQSGFTLLEVLVALTVISIGMAAALSLSAKSIDTFSVIEKKTYANWVAQNLIVEFKLQQDITAGTVEGEDDFAGQTWYWKADIKPTADEDVMQLHMQVSKTKIFSSVEADVTAYLSSVAA